MDPGGIRRASPETGGLIQAVQGGRGRIRGDLHGMQGARPRVRERGHQRLEEM